MKEDFKAYMSSQSDSRLLQLIEDASNYDRNAIEAAKNELIERGTSAAELEDFESGKRDAANQITESDALDSIWMKYKKNQTAQGLLLLLVLLLVFQIIRTVISIAFIHYSTGQDFGFIFSFYHIFLPLIGALFTAYSLWKLLPIAWIAAHLYFWIIIGNSVIELLNSYSEESSSFMGIIQNLSLNTILDVLIVIFLIYLLNQEKYLSLFKVKPNQKWLAFVAIPAIFTVVYYSFHLLGFDI